MYSDMKSNSNNASFWVSNISSRNVTLADLALNIRAFTTVNLMDKKHYQYTLEQLIKSKTSGSIFNKRDKIKVRESAPIIIKETVPFRHDEVMPSRERSILRIKTVEYDELKVSEDKEMQKQLDEEFAKESAELESSDDTNKK